MCKKLNAVQFSSNAMTVKWRSFKKKQQCRTLISCQGGQGGKSSGWEIGSNFGFLSSSAPGCKSYLRVHQKVKSIFILWDSLSFWEEQPREKNSFCLVWVWESVQPSDSQSEDWALILECYKSSVFYNIKVFNLAAAFSARSTTAPCQCRSTLSSAVSFL